MRNTLAALVALALGGCGILGGRREVSDGWEFRVVRPPVIRYPVLIDREETGFRTRQLGGMEMPTPAPCVPLDWLRGAPSGPTMQRAGPCEPPGRRQE